MSLLLSQRLSSYTLRKYGPITVSPSSIYPQSLHLIPSSSRLTLLVYMQSPTFPFLDPWTPQAGKNTVADNISPRDTKRCDNIFYVVPYLCFIPRKYVSTPMWTHIYMYIRIHIPMVDSQLHTCIYLYVHTHTYICSHIATPVLYHCGNKENWDPLLPQGGKSGQKQVSRFNYSKFFFLLLRRR